MKTTNRMRKFSAAIVCTGLLAAGNLWAGTAKPHVQHGTIKELDLNHNQLVVTDSKDKSARKFQWNDKTEFLEHGKRVAPSTVQTGDMARLTYTPGNKIPTAESVHIAPANHAKHTTPHSATKKH